ncbi:LexA family transcriptional regulator [Oceanibaculum indicum]|uniref:Uncharacterized protein n=1 Tax=Oceanibaculum indicum P24 TaxID=1207063 RepID=K2J1P0_9PROT|nr:hypothetical protein [Oceanibaculum indicum]EKE68712.1 hypothetical protein P24_17262 [Oceanibaculum indicum P24]
MGAHLGELTPLQARLVRCVADWHAETGGWPSVLQLATVLDQAYGSIYDRVTICARKKWLLRGTQRDPGIRLAPGADIARMRVAGVAALKAAGGAAGGEATRKRHRAARKAKQQRICLCCGNPFDSDGKHNRVCGSCKGTDGWRAGDLDAGYRVVL